MIFLSSVIEFKNVGTLDWFSEGHSCGKGNICSQSYLKTQELYTTNRSEHFYTDNLFRNITG